MRLTEMAAVYRAYQETLVATRGARLRRAHRRRSRTLFKRRPNILRRWQRQFRYILVDEFQDANQDLYHAREPDELGVVMPESPPSYTSMRIGARPRPFTTLPCASRGPMRRRLIQSYSARTDGPSRSSPTPMETPKPAGECWARCCGG